MNVGDRVVVVSPSPWRGQRGVVTQVVPCVMVLLEKERLPMRFDAVVPESATEPNMTGAE